MFLVLRTSVSSCVHFHSPWVASQGQRGWAPEHFSLHHHHPTLQHRFYLYLFVFRKWLLWLILAFHYAKVIFVVLLKMKKVLIWLICNHKKISEDQQSFKYKELMAKKNMLIFLSEQLYILLMCQHNIVCIFMVGHEIWIGIGCNTELIISAIIKGMVMGLKHNGVITEDAMSHSSLSYTEHNTEAIQNFFFFCVIIMMIILIQNKLRKW